MNSNRKFINFKELLLTKGEETNPIVIPCRNIKRAEEILKTDQIDSPHQIILHIGINDIDTQDTRDIAVKIKTLAEAYQTRFNCEVFVSEVIPRGDQYNSHVNTVNKELRQHLSNSMVKRISNENLNPSHLHDDRHLRRNKTHGELLSGVQLFAKNLFQSIINKPMVPQKIQKILRQTKKPPFRYQSQPRNDGKEKPNIYPENTPFFYMNSFYNNHQAQNCQKIKNILRIIARLKYMINTFESPILILHQESALFIMECLLFTIEGLQFPKICVRNQRTNQSKHS